MNELKLLRLGDVWHVIAGSSRTVVAEIHLDPWDQVDAVVLYADTLEQIQLEVLRLAASHARQYVRNRTMPAFGGLMVVEHRNAQLTREDSHRLMDFSALLPEIMQLDREQIEHALRQVNINVIEAIYRSVAHAVDDVIDQVKDDRLTYAFVGPGGTCDREVAVRFVVDDLVSRFTFWHEQSKPSDGGFDLYIVPPYHPVMHGKASVGLVNGSTDAYIGGIAVKSVYCPDDARVYIAQNIFGTWNHVNHPFYAAGRSVNVHLSTTKIRSKEGILELVRFLRAALGHDNAYVGISGGFQAPLQCAHNRLLESGHESPWLRAEFRRGVRGARGSEQHCVWAHRVLETEGQLKKAHIPSWFVSEGWMEIYFDAEVRPGIY